MPTYGQSAGRLSSFIKNKEISSCGFLPINIILPNLAYKFVSILGFLDYLDYVDQENFVKQKVYLSKTIQEIEKSEYHFKERIENSLLNNFIRFNINKSQEDLKEVEDRWKELTKES